MRKRPRADDLLEFAGRKKGEKTVSETAISICKFQNLVATTLTALLLLLLKDCWALLQQSKALPSNES